MDFQEQTWVRERLLDVNNQLMRALNRDMVLLGFCVFNLVVTAFILIRGVVNG